MNFDAAYDELAERIANRVVERLAGAEQPEEPEAWKLLTLKEAAERLTRSPSWLRERARRGDIPQVRLDGGALAFRLEDIQAFAQARRAGGDPDLRVVDTEWWRERLA
jgi:predicted DNA-binding transcriptional regulator AlpA